MSQYRTGRVFLTNGSAVVYGDISTVWTPIVTGAWLAVSGTAATYTVASNAVLRAAAYFTAYAGGTTYAKNDRVSYGGVAYISLAASNLAHQPDTSSLWWAPISGWEVTLSASWAGLTSGPVTYGLVKDFSATYNFPLPASGDVELAAIISRGFQAIETLLTGGGPGSFTTLSASGNFTLSATNSNILGGAAAGSSSLWNSTAAAGVSVYGPSHASKANDVEVFTGTYSHTFSDTGLAVAGVTTATGAFRSTGAAATNLTASATLDYSSGGRIIVQGGDATTVGNFNIILTEGDGGGSINPFYIASTGVASFGYGLAVTGALSTTGDITAGADIKSTYNTTIYSSNGGGAGTVQAGIQFVGSSDEVRIYTGEALRATVSNTGLAVTGGLDAVFTANTINGLELKDSTNTSGAEFAAFRKADATRIGGITRVTTTDAVAYNTTSDRRIKENIYDLGADYSGRLLDALTPRVFDRKDGTDSDRKGWLGFIAQEVHAADPIFARIGFVTPGDSDPETITKMWSVGGSPLDALLVAEIKVLRARVAELEAAA